MVKRDSLDGYVLGREQELLYVTDDAKINQLRIFLKANITVGEYSWATLRKKCGYEALFGNANNKRERDKFKRIIREFADFEELSDTKCLVKEIYTDEKEIILDLADGRMYGNNTGQGIWQKQTLYPLMLFINKQIDNTKSMDNVQFCYFTRKYLCGN